MVLVTAALSENLLKPVISDTLLEFITLVPLPSKPLLPTSAPRCSVLFLCSNADATSILRCRRVVTDEDPNENLRLSLMIFSDRR